MGRNVVPFTVAVLAAAGLHFLLWSRQDESSVRKAAPLALAVRRGDIELVRRFLYAGADPNERSGDRRKTALSRAVERCAMESELFPVHPDIWPQPNAYAVYFEITKALLDHGARVDAGGSGWGDSVIGDAIVAGDVKLVGLLAADGRAASARTAGGQTPLFAVGRNAGEFQQERHAVPGADLTRAIVRLLLKEGVPIDARDDEGRTALHEAALRGRHFAVQALIAAGADLNPVDKNGLRPLDCARTAEIEKALRDAGGKGLGE